MTEPTSKDLHPANGDRVAYHELGVGRLAHASEHFVLRLYRRLVHWLIAKR